MDKLTLSRPTVSRLLLIACLMAVAVLLSNGLLTLATLATAPVAIPARLVSQPHRPQPSDRLVGRPRRRALRVLVFGSLVAVLIARFFFR